MKTLTKKLDSAAAATIIYFTIVLVVATMLTSCSTSKRAIIGKLDACPKWCDNIKNPENEEFVEEVAFNLHKPVSQVTQQEFNNRYLNN